MIQMYMLFQELFRGYLVPNWCANHVEITGPKEKIKDLFDIAKNGDGLLEAMAPLGKWDYHDMGRAGGVDGGRGGMG